MSCRRCRLFARPAPRRCHAVPSAAHAVALSNDGKPDIYAATLAAEDLAVLGASYGDLRIVDPEEHQIPMSPFERSGSEGRLSLAITEAPRPAADKPRSPASTVLVVSYAPTGSGLSLPLRGPGLEVTDSVLHAKCAAVCRAAFGNRAVQAQGGERLLWSGTLSRKPDEARAAGQRRRPRQRRQASGSQHWQRPAFTLPSDLPPRRPPADRIDKRRQRAADGDSGGGPADPARLAAKLDGSTAYRLLLSAPPASGATLRHRDAAPRAV